MSGHDPSIGAWGEREHRRYVRSSVWRMAVGGVAAVGVVWLPIVTVAGAQVNPSAFSWAAVAVSLAWVVAEAWLVWRRRFSVCATILAACSTVPFWFVLTSGGWFVLSMQAVGFGGALLAGWGPRGLRSLKAEESIAQGWPRAYSLPADAVAVWAPRPLNGPPNVGYTWSGSTWTAVTLPPQSAPETWLWVRGGTVLYSAPERARLAFDRLQALAGRQRSHRSRTQAFSTSMYATVTGHRANALGSPKRTFRAPASETGNDAATVVDRRDHRDRGRGRACDAVGAAARQGGRGQTRGRR